MGAALLTILNRLVSRRKIPQDAVAPLALDAR
jgi:hypothetical protein